MQRRFRSRKKVCAFCADEKKVIDYKDTQTLRKYTSDRGKISPHRVSGCCAEHQRGMQSVIKRARQVVLLPYSAD